VQATIGGLSSKHGVVVNPSRRGHGLTNDLRNLHAKCQRNDTGKYYQYLKELIFMF
jgi:hypothetical protein